MSSAARYFAILLSALACAKTEAQTTRHVPAEYTSIQVAMNNSADGDIVLVAPGTYYEQLVFGSHQISVESSELPQAKPPTS